MSNPEQKLAAADSRWEAAQLQAANAQRELDYAIAVFEQHKEELDSATIEATEAQEVGTHGKIVDKLKKAQENGDNVVILTARSAHYRDETKKWLAKNGIPYDALVMRPSDNLSSDKKVKRELLEEDILPKFDVKKAYDDKKKNVKMFEKLGIDAKKVKP